jgi:mRNA interferase MazF
LADAGRGDFVLCQLTSNAYADPHAVELTKSEFASGSLATTSYARPGKLFTASERLIRRQAGALTGPTLNTIVEAAVRLLRGTR